MNQEDYLCNNNSRHQAFVFQSRDKFISRLFFSKENKIIAYRSMNKIEELLPTIQESVPTNYLPKIPEELEPRLKKVYSRYEHFIGIILGNFDRAEIEEDKQKYQYLLSPEKDGLPVFRRKEGAEYMHKKSGIDKRYCAVQMYQEYLDLVASGFIKGEEREQIEAEYYLTLNLIEEFSKKT